MKSTFFKVGALLALGAALVANTARADLFTYSSVPLAKIQFDGLGNFSFIPAHDSFIITSSSAALLHGDISGTYAIGAITTSGSKSTAPVTGSGVFTVHNGGGNDLTATLNWVSITQDGTGGDLNLSGLLNMTNIMYSGSDPTLMALAAAGNGANVLSFSFTPAKSLATLKTSAASTGFSGDVSLVPDGGTTAMLLGLGLTGLAMLARWRKIA